MKDYIGTAIMFAGGAISGSLWGLENSLVGILVGLGVGAACSYIDGFVEAWRKDH